MTLVRTIEDEQAVVSTAVIGALHALMGIAQDDDVEVEQRIDAASRILAYVSELEDSREELQCECPQEDGAGHGE